MGFDEVTGINFPFMQKEMTSYFGDPRDPSFAQEFLRRMEFSDLGIPNIGAIYGNYVLERPLRKAFEAIINAGLSDVITTYDGCWNIRTMKSQKQLSMHAWGIAVDFNAATNPFTYDDLVTDFPSAFILCFAQAGFEWGGLWNSCKDAMHFQLAWTRDWRTTNHPFAPVPFV
jgi:hypothetical protein